MRIWNTNLIALKIRFIFKTITIIAVNKQSQKELELLLKIMFQNVFL